MLTGKDNTMDRHELEEENRVLKSLFPHILRNLGNGANCFPEASIEFFKNIPEEVRLVIRKKDEEIKNLKSGLDKDGNGSAEHCCEELKRNLMDERDEADRCAGEALRKMSAMQDRINHHNDWLRKAKEDWGVSDNVSFDVIWEEALKLKNAKKGQ